MATVHELLLRAFEGVADDAALIAGFGSLRQRFAFPVADWTLQRGLQTPEFRAYGALATPSGIADADLRRLLAIVRELPILAGTAPTLDRLERVFKVGGASAGESPQFHYVVEMDPAKGWEDELFRWYDTEHMPGLAAVPGCVRAQRFLNRDSGPYSLACYDLTYPGARESPAWLAVRHTAWSDRVRPQFRNTRRTLFRSLPAG
jgi:hypothetical protein